MGLGTTELILILVIVLVLFGAKRLPEMGAGLARGIKSFRKNISDADDKKEEEEKKDDSASRDDTKAS